MKKALSIITILVITFSLFAQEQPNLLSSTKITTIGYWNRGDKVSYQVTNSSTTTKTGSTQPAVQSTSTYDLEITVVDSTEHSYILEMKYLTGSSEDLDPDLQEIMNTLQMRTIIRYQTDEFGSYEKILNIAELQAEFKRAFTEFKKKAADRRTPEEAKAFSSMMDALMIQFSKPENIEVLYLQDILGMHSYYGIELNMNKPMEVGIEFPCFANINVPGTGRITLSSINKAKDIAAFSITSKPNKEELKKYMKFFFDQFSPENKEKVPVEEMNIDFENTERLVIHLSTGWMQRIESSQTAIVSGAKEKVKKVRTKRYIQK